jgi:hypothetical protein
MVLPEAEILNEDAFLCCIIKKTVLFNKTFEEWTI